MIPRDTSSVYTNPGIGAGDTASTKPTLRRQSSASSSAASFAAAHQNHGRSSVGPDDEWKARLRAKIQDGMQSMVDEADAEFERRLNQASNAEERAEIQNERKRSMQDFTRMAEETFRAELAVEMRALSWAMGGEVNAGFMEEQQRIYETIKNSGGLQRQESLSPPGASSLSQGPSNDPIPIPNSNQQYYPPSASSPRVPSDPISGSSNQPSYGSESSDEDDGPLDDGPKPRSLPKPSHLSASRPSESTSTVHRASPLHYSPTKDVGEKAANPSPKPFERPNGISTSPMQVKAAFDKRGSLSRSPPVQSPSSTADSFGSISPTTTRIPDRRSSISRNTISAKPSMEFIPEVEPSNNRNSFSERISASPRNSLPEFWKPTVSREDDQGILGIPNRQVSRQNSTTSLKSNGSAPIRSPAPIPENEHSPSPFGAATSVTKDRQVTLEAERQRRPAESLPRRSSQSSASGPSRAFETSRNSVREMSTSPSSTSKLNSFLSASKPKPSDPPSSPSVVPNPYQGPSRQPSFSSPHSGSPQGRPPSTMENSGRSRPIAIPQSSAIRGRPSLPTSDFSSSRLPPPRSSDSSPSPERSPDNWYPYASRPPTSSTSPPAVYSHITGGTKKDSSSFQPKVSTFMRRAMNNNSSEEDSEAMEDDLTEDADSERDTEEDEDVKLNSEDEEPRLPFHPHMRAPLGPPSNWARRGGPPGRSNRKPSQNSMVQPPSLQSSTSVTHDRDLSEYRREAEKARRRHELLVRQQQEEQKRRENEEKQRKARQEEERLRREQEEELKRQEEEEEERRKENERKQAEAAERARQIGRQEEADRRRRDQERKRLELAREQQEAEARELEERIKMEEEELVTIAGEVDELEAQKAHRERMEASRLALERIAEQKRALAQRREELNEDQEEYMERQRKESIRRVEEKEAEARRMAEQRRKEAEAAKLRKQEEAAEKKREKKRRAEQKKVEDEERRREEEREKQEEAMRLEAEERQKRLEDESKKRREDERKKRLEEERKRLVEERRKRLQEEEEKKRKAEEERIAEEQRIEEARLTEERRQRQEVEDIMMARELEQQQQRQELERLRIEQEFVAQQKAADEKRKKEEEANKLQERFRQREEDIKRNKTGQQRQWPDGFDSSRGFSSSSPSTVPSSSSFRGSSASSTASSASSRTSASSSAWSSTTPKRSTTGASSASKSTAQSEADWQRRQEELFEQQQAKFREEQERLEAKHQAKSSKAISKDEIIRLYETHERQRGKLSSMDRITWDSLPWPLFKRPVSAEDITTTAVSAYMLSPHYPEKDKARSIKDRLKDHIRRWHPDRFETQLLPKVPEYDKERVKEGAGAVVRALNDLLTKQNGPASVFL